LDAEFLEITSEDLKVVRTELTPKSGKDYLIPFNITNSLMHGREHLLHNSLIIIIGNEVSPLLEVFAIREINNVLIAMQLFPEIPLVA